MFIILHRPGMILKWLAYKAMRANGYVSKIAHFPVFIVKVEKRNREIFLRYLLYGKWTKFFFENKYVMFDTSL